jgi:hypothetical protein
MAGSGMSRHTHAHAIGLHTGDVPLACAKNLTIARPANRRRLSSGPTAE